AGSVGPGWGNGKASAVAYAREGAIVACVDVNETAAQETVRIISGEGGKTPMSAVCDVTNEGQVKAVVDLVMGMFGRIDILHNNVGTTKMGGPPDITLEDWHRQIDINVTGAFLACRHVIPVMQAQGKGVITNISSAAGLRYTGYSYASYYAAKGAVNQFTVGIALQYAREGIRCNAILPGLMDTPLIHTQITGQYTDTAEMMARRHAASPTGKMGTGWDIANAAVFLASDEAAYINAVCLPVDGGLTARCS
ncbi:MAG: SDR family oxidoreductase, partial [Proteobacteria bacterium]|nr:SDR family oxidoreductase [Pseudomonadota bacterium]